jgi:hypothetical protein
VVRQHSTAQHIIYGYFSALSLNAGEIWTYRFKAYDGSHLIIQLKRRKSRIKTAFDLEEPFYLE